MKIIIAALLIMTLLLVGCDRYLETGTITEPEPADISSPTNIRVTLNDQAISLTWEHADSELINRFKVYTYDINDSTYTLHDSTTAYSYTFSNLITNKIHYFSISSVGTNGLEGSFSAPITAYFGPLSIIISNGDRYTNRKQVQVQLNSNNLSTHYMLSEDSTFSNTVFESFVGTTQFELSDGEGLKTIYARLLFSDGSSTAGFISDDITLDLKAEISSVDYSPAGPFVTGDTILFTLDAIEVEGEATVSIAGGPTVTLHDDGVSPDQTLNDGIYSGDLIIQPDLVLADARLTGSFTDQAGNNITLISDQLLNITTIPTAVQIITTEAISSSEISLSWTQSSTQDFDSYRIFRALDNSVDNSNLPLTTINSQTSVSWTDTTALASTTYYYRVYVYNSNIESVGSNVDSATSLVNDLPDPVVLAGVLLDSLNIRLTWSQSNAEDFASYRIYSDSQTMTDTTDGTLIELENSRSTTTNTYYAPDNTTYYYRVYVFDKQGAYSGSNVVSVTK